MSGSHPNTFPKLHNAAWPGVVGKGEGSEPPIDLDTMLDLTAAAEVDGVKFDGFDLFLFAPHINIDATDDELKALAERRPSRGLTIGSVVAPVWPPTGGGSAMDEGEGREKFLEQVRKGCRIAKTLREIGRAAATASSASTRRAAWATGPPTPRGTSGRSPRRSSRPPRSPGTPASGWPPRGRSAGAACTPGGRWSTCSSASASRRRSASRPTWPTRCSTRSARTPRKTASCPGTSTGATGPRSTQALKTLTAALRPWTIDFHVAQNDATVFGSGSHDQTGRHCLATDPNGKLDIPRHAGFWLRDEEGRLTKKFRHICWDGCMFPNAVMMKPETWNDILAAMIAVRDAHGWHE